MVFTTAGKFQQTQQIAHIMIDRDNDNVSMLKDRMQKALEKTEENAMTSIAFPAVGTG